MQSMNRPMPVASQKRGSSRYSAARQPIVGLKHSLPVPPAPVLPAKWHHMHSASLLSEQRLNTPLHCMHCLSPLFPPNPLLHTSYTPSAPTRVHGIKGDGRLAEVVEQVLGEQLDGAHGAEGQPGGGNQDGEHIACGGWVGGFRASFDSCIAVNLAGSVRAAPCIAHGRCLAYISADGGSTARAGRQAAAHFRTYTCTGL